MKRKNKLVLSVLLLVVVILAQVLFVHPGVMVDNVYAIGTPVGLIELLRPTSSGQSITDYRPVDANSPAMACVQIERAIRSSMTGTFVLNGLSWDSPIFSYMLDEMKTQCFSYLIIWVFLILEIVFFAKFKKDKMEAPVIILFLCAALSVNLWAELLYVAFGYMNAILSFGISFFLCLIVWIHFTNFDTKNDSDDSQDSASVCENSASETSQ